VSVNLKTNCIDFKGNYVFGFLDGIGIGGHIMLHI
jgi:hypothetical protein